MELYLIRHGEIAGDPHRFHTPPVQGCLSELGQRQATSLAEALADVRFDAIYASPLGRAVQTAQSLTAASEVVIQIRPWLREWIPATVFGECDETQFEQILKNASALPPEQTWKTDAGEGLLEMAHRIIPPFLQLLAQHGFAAAHGGYVQSSDAPLDQRVALVAHGGSLGLLCAFLLGIPLKPGLPIQFEQTGTAFFRFVRQADVWYPKLVIAPPRKAESMM